MTMAWHLLYPENLANRWGEREEREEGLEYKQTQTERCGTETDLLYTATRTQCH